MCTPDLDGPVDPGSAWQHADRATAARTFPFTDAFGKVVIRTSR
jgi:hypothetical protein